MRIPGPRTIAATLKQVRQVRANGGPASIRIDSVERPRGLIFPTSELSLSIEARSGATVTLTPELPVPWPWAWGYRLARRLQLPIARSLEPHDFQFSLPIPAAVGRHLAADQGVR
jgi:hypothetical protein